VRRSLLVFGLSFTACSGRDVGSDVSWGSQPVTGQQTQIAQSDTAMTAVASGDVAGDQPSVLVRCENGRIEAYVMADPTDSLTEAHLVPIDLDSAPGC
jgi:hypothetical protein